MKPLTSSDPDHVGPNRLLARLGAGAMGQVYLARTPGHQLAAVKVVRPELAEDTGFLARFAREVRTAQRVHGPFTPAVLDADPDSATPWMATEYAPGPTLTEAVRANGPFPEETLWVLALGLAQALQAVHAAGLMHRDLKPGNILLSPRGPQVIDFGIARAVEGTVLTKTGEAFGTPSYASPEQVLGHTTGPASDVFSLAGVVVHAACGTPPFGRAAAAQILHRVVSEEPRLSEVPEGLRPLLSRCLAKDPAERPASAEIVRTLSARPLPPAEQGWLPHQVSREIDDRQQELHRVVAAPSEAPSPGRSGGRRGRRGLLVAGAAGAAAVLLAGAGLAVTRPWEGADSADGNPADPGDSAPEGSEEGAEDRTGRDTDDQPQGPAFPGTFNGMYFTPDGDELYVNTSHAVTVWDWREGELVDTAFSEAEGTRPHSFDLGADGTMAGAFEDRVTLWDSEHGELASYTSEAPDELDLFDSVSLSEDGSLVAFRERDLDKDVTVRVWDWADDTVVWEREMDVMAPEVSPDGSYLVVDHGSGLPRLEVIDLADDATVAEFPEEEPDEDGFHPVYDHAFAPQGPLIGVSGATEETTVLYDLAEGGAVHEFDSPGTPFGVAFTPDGSQLLTGRTASGMNPGGHVWDTETGEALTADNSVVYERPAVHPRGEAIAVADSDTEGTTVLFLDPETFRDTHEIS
ncbi:WD40 repeat domain-containing serine/threonine protein kinase [Nocardiopsis oceani]